MSPEREEDSHFDFEILRRFYKVKITPKITLDGTSTGSSTSIFDTLTG